MATSPCLELRLEAPVPLVQIETIPKTDDEQDVHDFRGCGPHNAPLLGALRPTFIFSCDSVLIASPRASTCRSSDPCVCFHAGLRQRRVDFDPSRSNHLMHYDMEGRIR